MENKILSSSEAYERIKICQECEKFLKLPRICGKCKCFIPSKSRWRNSKCPLGKW